MRSLFVALTCAIVLVPLASAQRYTATVLTSNGPASGPNARADSSLVNGWGISRSSTSPWWVSDNGTGLSTLYNGEGAKQALVVTVPGGPTGTVWNGTPDFEVAPGRPGSFLFAALDGTISGWNSGVNPSQAIVVATNPGAVYTGMAIASVNGKNRIYAADFKGRKIDVYDSKFQLISGDNGLGDDDGDTIFRFPAALQDYAPFNIQNIGGTLYIAFAKHNAAGEELKAPSTGIVAAFTPSGQPIRMFERVAGLNAPWGLVMAPGDFGVFSHHLLVGQFGSGEILAFNATTGRYSGKMLDQNGSVLKIDGLWGLSFGNGRNAGPSTTLFFAGGPNDEHDGVFGQIVPIAADLTLGNGN
jgi:uncharacterized protein (TIGR03118 family)